MSRALLYLTLLVVGFTLFTTPLGATPVCVQKAAAEHAGLPVGDAPVIENADPLFFELPASVAVGDTLRFEITVGDSVSLTETVELTRAPAAVEGVSTSAVSAVELLAAQPARLDFLRRAAAENQVEILVTRGETVLGTYAFGELAAASESLAPGGVRPFDLRSTLEVERARPALGESPSWKYTCEELCDLDQEDCYYYRCDQFGPPSCYQACDDQWEDCLTSCGFCQPSSSSTTTTTIQSSTPISGLICKRSFFSSATGHQRLFRQQLKHTTTTTTINSDCSQTVTTSITYSTEDCWKWIDFNSCAYQLIENPAANC